MFDVNKILWSKNDGEGDGPIGIRLPMDHALPPIAISPLTLASSLLDIIESQVIKATHIDHIRLALRQITRIREYQDEATKCLISFHEEHLSKTLSIYDRRIHEVQQEVIINKNLCEESKTIILTRSANTFERERYAIINIKHGMQDFKVRSANLAKSRMLARDAIWHDVKDLDNAPPQEGKLAEAKSYASFLLQAERCLFQLACNELEYNHKAIANHYNEQPSVTDALPTSFFEGSHFDVASLSHSLLKESLDYIEKAEQFDKVHSITASSLLLHAHTLLRTQRTLVFGISRTSDPFYRKVRVTLFSGVNRLTTLIEELQNATYTPKFADAVSHVLQVVEHLQYILAYLQTAQPAKGTLKTLRKLMNQYEAALTASENMTSVATGNVAQRRRRYSI